MGCTNFINLFVVYVGCLCVRRFAFVSFTYVLWFKLVLKMEIYSAILLALCSLAIYEMNSCFIGRNPFKLLRVFLL